MRDHPVRSIKFLILLRLTRCCGYRPAVLNKIYENLTRLRAENDPVLRHDRFVEEIMRDATVDRELQVL